MKKIFSITIIITLLSLAPIKPAQALIIDPTSYVNKVTEWVKKIQDATNKIQQQVQQIKLSSLQGFKKDYLKGIAEDYLKDYATDFAKKQLKMVVASSKEKEKEKLSDEQEFNKETQNKYYEAKGEIIEGQLKETLTEKEKIMSQKETICNVEVPTKKSTYEGLKSSKASIEKITLAENEYVEAQMKCEELELTLEQVTKYEEVLNENKAINEKEKQIVGTDADPTHKKYQERIDMLASVSDELAEIGGSETIDEWDDKKALKTYKVSKADYVKFIDTYFFDEDNIQEGLVGTQTEMDRVMRNRRRLLINSASHLLQVSASSRRDIPTKTKKIKEMYDEVRTTEDEFKAIGYYSGSKLDNTRALILYAKVLSTKLQYMAAKDLLVIEARRRGRAEDVDAENFDLGKYKLTDSYVQAIEEESNKGIDIHAGVETN